MHLHIRNIYVRGNVIKTDRKFQQVTNVMFDNCWVCESGSLEIFFSLFLNI